MAEKKISSGSESIGVSLIHPDFLNAALRYAEIEPEKVRAVGDGEGGSIRVDFDGLSDEEVVSVLVNGLMLAYAKATAADAIRRREEQEEDG